MENMAIVTRSMLRHPPAHYLRWGWVRSFLRSKWTYVIWPEWYHWKLVMLMHIPGRIGSAIRRRATGFGRCGRNVYIGDHVWFQAPSRIIIGDDVRIHPTCRLDGVGGIEIGSHVGIGPGAQIYSQNHGYKDKDQLYYYQPYALAKVVIEDDVWVGAGSLIMAGKTIRQGTIIAAGSVVTKDTESYSVVAGVPAKKIGQRE